MKERMTLDDPMRPETEVPLSEAAAKKGSVISSPKGMSELP